MVTPFFATAGMREAAGGRQPAAAKPYLYNIYMLELLSVQDDRSLYGVPGKTEPIP